MAEIDSAVFRPQVSAMGGDGVIIRVSALLTAGLLASCGTVHSRSTPDALPPPPHGEVEIESRSLLGDFQTTVDATREPDGRWTVHESRTAFRNVSHKTFRLKRVQAEDLETLLNTPGLMDPFDAGACLDPPSIRITVEWRDKTETARDDCQSSPLRRQLLDLLYRR